jgi:hypothetical protein
MMKRAMRLLPLLAISVACVAIAQVPTSRYDPGVGRRPAQQKSFIEWAFSQINPRNIDYGARIEAMRQDLLDRTIRNPESWGKALLVAALLGLYVAYWCEVRRSGRTTVSTARVITGYENELMMARGQITKLTAEYMLAKRILDDQMEAVRSQKSKPTNAAPTEEGLKGNASENGKDKPNLPQSEGQDSEVNQQLLAANQTIGSLRRQVSTLTKKYEEEQQKNRKLKGES